VWCEVLNAVSIKMAVFWVVASCRRVQVYQSFRGPCCLHHQGDEWWWVRDRPDDKGSTGHTTRRYILEVSHLPDYGRSVGKSTGSFVLVCIRICESCTFESQFLVCHNLISPHSQQWFLIVLLFIICLRMSLYYSSSLDPFTQFSFRIYEIFGSTF
jgi:hypothetical protein